MTTAMNIRMAAVKTAVVPIKNGMIQPADKQCVSAGLLICLMLSRTSGKDGKGLMQKLRKFLGGVLFCLMLFCGAALAQEARDITGQCTLKGSLNPQMVLNVVDRDYHTYWRSQPGSKAWLEVTLPAGETCGSVYIKWAQQNIRFCVQANTGTWVTVARCDTGRFAEYVPLPEDATSFRIVPDKGEKGRLIIAELYVLSPGEAPGWVQKWQPPPEKADLLVLFAHPDDEVLFIGGTIPYYAGELQKKVVAACVVPASSQRSLEVLDSLWLCGLRYYPSFGPMRDNFAMSLEGMYAKWRKEKLYHYVVWLLRRFKPDVVVSHDVQGEYGHGAHRATADAARQAVAWAASAKRYPDSAKEFGVWKVPKLYLHLYKENMLDMDWRRPLNAFLGKTAFDIAQEGYACHKSQQQTEYVVEDFGPYDNSQFGLVYTSVGPDVKKDDFFENISKAQH